MGYIFYAFGTLILLSTLASIFRFNKIYSVKEWYIKFKKVTDKDPKKEDFRSKDSHTLYTNQNALLMIELIWICLGLFTSNWYIFFTILLYGILLNITLSKIRFTFIGKVISFKFLLLRAVIYTYLIINHFYLHLDLFNLIVT